MDGKANKEVSKSAVDRGKGKRGGEGTDRGKGRKGKERNRKDNGKEQERTQPTSAVTFLVYGSFSFGFYVI